MRLDTPAERSLSAHVDLARDEQLARQRSIFAEPAPSAADIKLYGMVAAAKEGGKAAAPPVGGSSRAG